MAGHATNQFARGAAGTPLDMAAAAARAAQDGIDTAAFSDLPIPAKLAWCWVAFNEPAVEALDKLPNARVVIYEHLCRQPETVARELFAFAGLHWDPRTTAFLDTSTRHDQASGYFDVFRATNLVADRWRQSMSQQDQEAVRKVVATSSLARCWPDLASAAT